MTHCFSHWVCNKIEWIGKSRDAQRCFQYSLSFSYSGSLSDKRAIIRLATCPRNLYTVRPSFLHDQIWGELHTRRWNIYVSTNINHFAIKSTVYPVRYL